MGNRAVIRRIVEEDHGVASYIDDPAAADNDNFYLPAGRLVDIECVDDDGVVSVHPVWIPPGRSIGTAQPTRRTKAHSRGYLNDDRTHREIGFSSTHELHAACVFLADRNVLDIEDQPPAVAYLDADGRPHTHRYDFRIRFNTGLIVAVDVKPRSLVESSKINQTREFARPNLVGFADKDILVTDRTASRERGWNARKMIKARKIRDAHHNRKMAEWLPDIHGTVSAYQLARQFPSFAEGMNAVWCLLHDGLLKFADVHQKMPDFPYVRVNHRNLALAA